MMIVHLFLLAVVVSNTKAGILAFEGNIVFVWSQYDGGNIEQSLV